MTDSFPSQRLFTWLDRAFWLIWAGYPLLIWTLVREVLTAPHRLAQLAPDQAACLSALPLVTNFTPTGQTVFWLCFGVEFTVYAVLLALAHGVIHACAQGRVLVTSMIGALRRIGLVIALWPLADALLQNLQAAVYAATGDLPVFEPYLALDLPVLGVGLLMVTMAAAMRQAVALRRDADLTI